MILANVIDIIVVLLVIVLVLGVIFLRFVLPKIKAKKIGMKKKVSRNCDE